MNYCKIFSRAAVIVPLLASNSIAQDTPSLPYIDPKLSAEERAADLVHRMTLRREGLPACESGTRCPALDPAAVAAAKNADVVVAVVGITSRLEGEEMPVSQPGFSGGDRTSLDLPTPEEDLIEALAASGKSLVIVLMNGSALSVKWAKEHANAILESWYSGEEGGAAIAETSNITQ